MISNILRRLRGALGNALVWASTWFVAAFPLTAVFYFFGYFGSQPFWPIALGTATSLTGIGFLAGTAFSLFLGIAGRNHRLQDLRPFRFALGSGITAGLIIPAFGIVVNTLGGFSTPLGPSVVVASVAAVLTGFTALGQIKIAQGALKAGDGSLVALETASEQLLSASDPEMV
ncbi:MAG: hypothetical protein HKO65_14180 [Gemmatimonadetes bacterium]|nr:hypothetical protein [Gemmatimonadota bacterium]